MHQRTDWPPALLLALTEPHPGGLMQPIYRQPAPILRIADLNEPIWLSPSPSPSSGTLGPGV